MPAVLKMSDLFSHPANFFALGFGTGLSRYAPGTVGSLVGLPLVLIMPVQPLLYGTVLLLLFAFGVWCCHESSLHLGVHDHPGIVWDEIVGMLIVLYAVPHTLLYLLLGFLMFRLFDILKPWPIGWVDKQVEGGLGIMLDDVLAGLMAWISMQAIIHWIVPAIVSLIT